jgi:hypothetical protein
MIDFLQLMNIFKDEMFDHLMIFLNFRGVTVIY